MGRYVARRLIMAVPLLLGISVISFMLLKAVPGGPLAAYEANPDVTPADLARLEHEFGLDQPLPVQYISWLGRFVSGDWGYSIAQHLPVRMLILERLPNTMYLMSIVFVVTLAIAIPAGVITAVRQYSKLDILITSISFAGYSMPTFWFGLLLIILFGLTLRWLPLGGMTTPGASGFDAVDRVRHLVLPVATLSLFGMTRYVRFLRASMLETINQDYMRTARSKGLMERIVVLRHAFKNAAIPLVTVAALDLPELFGGALVTEQIFGWPGMGRLLWDATTRLDYPILMGILLVSASLIVMANLIADVFYGYLDPRIRFA
jgi:peptide/nickel transport system permease protein